MSGHSCPEDVLGHESLIRKPILNRWSALINASEERAILKPPDSEMAGRLCPILSELARINGFGFGVQAEVKVSGG